MKIKVVLLMGGVGNRLFQIARAWDLKLSGYDVKVVSIEMLPVINFLVRRLLYWTQHHQWIDIGMLCSTLGISKRKLSLLARCAVYVELLRLFVPGGRARMNLKGSLDSRIVHVGYFQEWECISAYSVAAVSDALVKVLPLSTHPSHESVLHIRGGDFSLKDRVSAADVFEFYNAANGNCLVVSNDVVYVTTKFPTLKFERSSCALHDFLTICKAKKIMPSNSTFCFWACTVAIRLNKAKLWFRPADPYWDILGSEVWNGFPEKRR